MSDALRRIDVRTMPPVPEDEQIELDGRMVSMTLLDFHDNCDRAAYLYRRWSGGAPSHHLNRGSLFHIWADTALNYLIERNEPKLPGEVGKDILLDVLKANPTLAVPARERDVLRELVWNWCEKVVIEDPRERIAGIEVPMNLQIGDWTIRCRLDLVLTNPQRVGKIIDWKTSWALDDNMEWVENDLDALEPGQRLKWGGNFQTQVYALAVADGLTNDGLPLGHDIDQFVLEQQYPRYKWRDGLARRRAVIRRQQLLDFRLDLEAQLERLEASLESRLWQPTPGSHCSTCPAPRACPLPRHLRPDSQLPVDAPIEDAIALAQWWHFNTDDGRDVKARLKRWASANETAIPYGKDLELAFVTREKREIKDRDALEQAVTRSAEFGEEFDYSQHEKRRPAIEFIKRKTNKKEGA